VLNFQAKQACFDSVKYLNSWSYTLYLNYIF
jgi:hypothetical protein